jgi:acyl-coenzyme A thioesterase PaaI-like protein
MAFLPVYKNSFFCGHDRKDGLGLTIEYDGDLVYCHVKVDTRFEGYEDVVHGGIVMGILDTMMWYAIVMETKKICVTRHTGMDFYRPVMCNTPYIARAVYEGMEDRDIIVRAFMEDSNGDVCAKLTGTFREAKDGSFNPFVDRFDFSRCTPEISAHFRSIPGL